MNSGKHLKPGREERVKFVAKDDDYHLSYQMLAEFRFKC